MADVLFKNFSNYYSNKFVSLYFYELHSGKLGGVMEIESILIQWRSLVNLLVPINDKMKFHSVTFVMDFVMNFNSSCN